MIEKLWRSYANDEPAHIRNQDQFSCSPVSEREERVYFDGYEDAVKVDSFTEANGFKDSQDGYDVFYGSQWLLFFARTGLRHCYRKRNLVAGCRFYSDAQGEELKAQVQFHMSHCAKCKRIIQFLYDVEFRLFD